MMFSKIIERIAASGFPVIAIAVLNLASRIFGGGSRISFQRPHYWDHTKYGLTLAYRHPSFRFDFHEFWREVNPIFFHTYCPESGDVCVDIGAGLGEQTIYMAKAVGVTGKVIAIEASPTTFDFLSRNVQANNLSNCVAMHVAISDQNRPVKIESHIERHNYNRLVVGDYTISDESEGSIVEGHTIDRLLTDLALGPIDFMKVNIEGAEHLLIKEFNCIKYVRNVAIACHDFLDPSGESKWYCTRQRIEQFLKENNFSITSQSTGIGYIDDWVYGANQGL